MTFILRITRNARDDLDEIYTWIATESLQAADNWLDDIEARIASLRDYPQRHPVAPEAKPFAGDIRHMIAGNFRIIYETVGDTVFVLHVRHAARRPLRRRKPL